MATTDSRANGTHRQDLCPADQLRPGGSAPGMTGGASDQLRINQRVWLTFSGRAMVETPALWRMSRAYPQVSFDIRQASVTAEIGVMAVHFEGAPDQVNAALEFLRGQGVLVEPIEKNMIES